MKVYLGDSVYAETTDLGEIVLTTENGIPEDPTNIIYLSSEVIASLLRFIQIIQSKEVA